MRTLFVSLIFCRVGRVLAHGIIAVGGSAAIDMTGSGLGDIWEMKYQASALLPNEDEDGDGHSNWEESIAGTDPFDNSSRLDVRLRISGNIPILEWMRQPGKEYRLFSGAEPGTIAQMEHVLPPGLELTLAVHPAENLLDSRGFYRVEVADVDTDGDGVSDFEEITLGFDATRANTERYPASDLTRIQQQLHAPNSISVSVYDTFSSEAWPDPILFVIRREGGLAPLSVPFMLSGSAVQDIDYEVHPPGGVAEFAPGQREVIVAIHPTPDNDHQEGDETVVLNVLPGTGYSFSGPTSITGRILDSPPGAPPCPKESARFLLHAAFGPSQDADGDGIPDNVVEVQALGLAGWIQAQFGRPIGFHQPFVEWFGIHASAQGLYGDPKQYAWWNRAMGVPTLRPDSPHTQLPDPLRQRVAFALSQIFVISDRLEDLAVSPGGMANYYDMLVAGSFGNFYDLLLGVTLHPCMGMYLSHLGNRKANPSTGTFPDENFAREVMQLFTIGLWMLNPDGTQELDSSSQPIATYDNDDITEFGRVFTGIAFGGPNTDFGLWPRDFTSPMKAWDSEHDLGPKTLLGVALPARVASPNDTGTATMQDIHAALGVLFNHPNTGPFIASRLIQRLTSSNPSPAYIKRVADAFSDNGSGVRGDMRAVISAILLDPEARSYAASLLPHAGRAREPFLRAVNLATALNASAPVGYYALDAFALDHAQEPYNSPSVFNFYLPSYMPPGEMTALGLVGPEFHLYNATTMHTGPNYFWNALAGGLHRWGTANPNHNVSFNLALEMAYNIPPLQPGDDINVPAVDALDPDPLIRRLDLALTGGMLQPHTARIIREAMNRVGPPTWRWHHERLRLAIYLVVTSPEFAIIQ